MIKRHKSARIVINKRPNNVRKFFYIFFFWEIVLMMNLFYCFGKLLRKRDLKRINSHHECYSRFKTWCNVTWRPVTIWQISNKLKENFKIDCHVIVVELLMRFLRWRVCLERHVWNLNRRLEKSFLSLLFNWGIFFSQKLRQTHWTRNKHINRRIINQFRFSFYILSIFLISSF